MNEFSFEKGWQQVRQMDVPEVRRKLMEALKIKSNASFLERKRGLKIPKVTQAAAIEEVFKQYGIKKIWG